MGQTESAFATVEKVVNQTVLRLRRGDLTALPVDAFVFYAQENLELGSGFGTAMQIRGGEAIRKELQRIGSIGMGEAVITTAGNMGAKHIIHACGPKFQEPEMETKLRQCVLSSLKCADENGLASIAFPPMGAGFYGIPLEMCAKVMLQTIRTFVRGTTLLREVIVCVIDNREFAAFQKALEITDDSTV
jgi:O-acetyl-ADP-ribose deacetylase (regulator of RNase III)